MNHIKPHTLYVPTETPYAIHIAPHALEQTNVFLEPFCKSNIIIITDDNVAPHHLPQLEKNLQQLAPTYSIILPHGEHLKSITHYSTTAEAILHHGIDRGTMLVALGGGVIGDITGFLASTLYRGIPYCQIPTSLLAQIDSSIGGKTAINIGHSKNTVGTFYQPKTVIIDPLTLKTLPQRHLNAAYGEIIKYAYLDTTGELYDSIFTHLEGKKMLDGHLEEQINLIKKSIQIKKDFVIKDEKENNIRKFLNFGHTFAHAMESYTHCSDILFHGEAVILGVLMALKLSHLLGLTQHDESLVLKKHLDDLKLPTTLQDFDLKTTVSPKNIINLMKKFDKKSQNLKMNLVLYQSLGCFLLKNTEDEWLTKAIKDFI